jgi:hypothetical protein
VRALGLTKNYVFDFTYIGLGLGARLGRAAA